MAIYRGAGGAGDSNTDATLLEVTEQAVIATTKASDAAASASAAATSETNAATSATASASSATAAASSASGVSASATAAANSATAAANSATAASTAETNAETAETNAETAESTASPHATTATTKAAEAATSATSASTSASTATTKASEASTSASSASTSATTATTKASEATTSATSASTSASTATTKASEAATSATNAATSATASATSATASATSASNASAALSSAALKANNLSDLANAGTARTNLGLGTAATTASTDYATSAQGTTADNALPKAGGTVTGDLSITSTGAILLPTGTTAQRPTAVAGKLRYNSTTGGFEGYTTEWGSIGGIGDEYITPTPTLSSPNANEIVIGNYSSYISPVFITKIGSTVISNTNNAGTLTLVPPSGISGTQTVSVEVVDLGKLYSASATVSVTISLTTARYWRITKQVAGAADWPAYTYWQLFSGANGSGSQLGSASAITANYNNASYNVQNLYAGVSGGFGWYPYGYTGTVASLYVQYDLGTPQEVLSFKYRNHLSYAADYYASSFTLQKSDDGTNWEDVKVTTQTTGETSLRTINL